MTTHGIISVDMPYTARMCHTVCCNIVIKLQHVTALIICGYIKLHRITRHIRARVLLASNKKMDGVWSQLVGRECGRCDTDRLARVGL